MENYFEIDEPKKVKGFTVGKLFKFIFLAIIVFVYACIIVRCSMASDHKIVEKIITDEITENAYLSDKESFTVERYGTKNAWVAVSERRLIEFNNLYHLKNSRQLQFSVKYNTDIAKNIGVDGIPFKFKLVNENGEEYTDYFFETASKFNFRYIRVCFNGIDLIDETKEPDENGIYKRHTYTLYINKLNSSGEYEEYTNYKIYDGSRISQKVKFKFDF